VRRGLASAGVVFLVAAGMAGMAATARAAKPLPFVGPRIARPSVTPDFVLHDQNGRVVRLSSQRGKVTVLTFLYTHCPDLCPLTAEHINTALGRLGAKRKGVTVLAVTVDPKGDTPTSVRSFVRSHHLLPQFRYLTGTPKALGRIWRLYNVTALTRAAADPDHTLYVLLLDRSGKTRVLFDATAASSAIVHDLRLLLR
jgi:protein SCO1/2